MDKDVLYRFFEGQASTEEMQSIKEWSEASEENSRQLRRERKLFNAMILIGHSSDNIKTDAAGYNRRIPFRREFMKMASAVAIAVAVTAAWFSIGKDNEEGNAAMQTVTVPAGQRVNLSLPDGSNVWLNAGTKMQYPLSFGKGKREVILDGEAYFEVAHKEKCPFVVRTYAMDVEVLGTTFNIDASSVRKVFEASLIKGKIQINSPHKEETSTILSPDHKTTLIDGKLVISRIDDYNVYRWTEGLYCFKNTPFTDIMKGLERYYDLKIHIERKSIEEVVLTGKFRISDGLDYALRVLQNDVTFTYCRNKETNTVYIK